jgi:hypothetical protein
MPDLFGTPDPAPAPRPREIRYSFDTEKGWMLEMAVYHGERRHVVVRIAHATRERAEAQADRWHRKHREIKDVYDDSWVARSIVQDAARAFEPKQDKAPTPPPRNWRK